MDVRVREKIQKDQKQEKKHFYLTFVKLKIQKKVFLDQKCQNLIEKRA